VWRCKLVAEQHFDGIDNRLLQTRREWPGLVVIDHSVGAFVPALFQNPLRGDVAGHVVRIRVDPKPAAVEFSLQALRIIDDDLARQEYDAETVAERPCLDAKIDNGL